MRGFARAAVVAAAMAVAGVYGAACTSTSAPDDTGGTDVGPSLADVVFVGNATSTALASLLRAETITSAAIGPRIVSPPTDTTMAGSEPFTFAWEPRGSTSARLLPAERPLLPAWLTELLGPERAAQAATARTTGRGYYLVFSTPAAPRLLRVFTMAESYTPDKTAWDTLRSVGEWTKLTIVTADFSNDALLPASGPFTGDPVEFCIEPQ